MCSFIRARISPAIARSNILLLSGTRYKEAYICKRPDMADGSVIALLVPKRGYGSKRIDSWAAVRKKGIRERQEDGDRQVRGGEAEKGLEGETNWHK